MNLIRITRSEITRSFLGTKWFSKSMRESDTYIWIKNTCCRLENENLSLASIIKLINNCPSPLDLDHIETIVKREVSLSQKKLKQFMERDNNNVELDFLKQEELDRKLIEAVVADSLEQALLLLKKGANASASDEASGKSVLIEASKIGNYHIVGALLVQNADISMVDNWGATALLVASCHGRADIVELLLLKKANPNDCSNILGSALVAASSRNHPEVVKVLLEYGATDVGAAFDEAGINGHFEVQNLLAQTIIRLLRSQTKSKGRARTRED
jgi:ankyrin repeat protein